jgi:twitching motility two-component system response regulator PilG
MNSTEVSTKNSSEATVSNINPLELIQRIAESSSTLAIKLEHNSVIYSFYFSQGKLIYCTHSVEPDERVERHLRALANNISTLDKNLWTKVKLEFEETELNLVDYPPEYAKIAWMRQRGYLNSQQIIMLKEALTQEVFESLILIKEIQKDKIKKIKHNLISIFELDLDKIIKKAREQIDKWQELTPEINSPYQRPYLLCNDAKISGLSLEQQQKLSQVLRGFNFRQLSLILNQDELVLAKRLYPLIERKTIILRNPTSAYEKLPILQNLNNQLNLKSKIQANTQLSNVEIQKERNLLSLSNTSSLTKNYKIVCVDDSPIVLKSITDFLDQDNLSIFPITNSAKAMILIAKIKPDLIFMDIGMPNIDGYQLCSLLRKHPEFSQIPIIMLTGNTGIINRAKAKISGATDYMTKPFSQEDLLRIIFRYLSSS